MRLPTVISPVRLILRSCRGDTADPTPPRTTRAASELAPRSPGSRCLVRGRSRVTIRHTRQCGVCGVWPSVHDATPECLDIHTQGSKRLPAWSPNGAFIALEFGGRILRMAADGTD